MKKAEKSSDGMLIMFNCILCSFCDKLFDSGTSKGQNVNSACSCIVFAFLNGDI